MPLQTCYLCGVALVDSPPGPDGFQPDNARTRDHIPPKGLFVPPLPDNLITVDCCNRCNGEHIDLDEQLRLLAAFDINRSVAGGRPSVEGEGTAGSKPTALP
jgi:hypothetical protein